MKDGNGSAGVAAGRPRGGHAGPGLAPTPGGPAWAPLYDAVAAMIADGRLEPDALIVTVSEAAALWSITPEAAQRAYTALERDGLLARCPHCRQWVVMPMASCVRP